MPYVLAPEGAIPLEMWSRRYFERNELDFVLNALAPGMIFVDVGANVGLFSVPAAKKVGPGKVYAFEPTSSTFAMLTKNARLNKVENLEAVHSAVADHIGTATLSLNVADKDGLNTIGKPAHEDAEVVGAESVPVITIDEFARQKGISRVDVMKVDVEGAEMLVFRGAVKLLAGAEAPLILYEGGFLTKGFDYHPVETMWLLEKLGYELFVIDSNSGQISGPAPGRAYPAMVIAVKPTHSQYAKIKGQA